MCGEQKSLLIINSKERDGTLFASSSEFSYSPKHGIKYNTIRIKYVMIPLAYYNINSNNNTFIFNEGGSDLTATITPGTYSKSEFITELKTKLDSSGSQTYSVVDSDTTNNITISAAGNFQIIFSEFSTAAKRIYNSGSSDTSNTTSHTIGPIDISGVNIINIESNLRLYKSVRSNRKMVNNILVSIPVSPYTTNEILSYAPQYDIISNSYEDDLGEIKFKLYNEFGELIDLNNVDWTICFEFW